MNGNNGATSLPVEGRRDVGMNSCIRRSTNSAGGQRSQSQMCHFNQLLSGILVCSTMEQMQLRLFIVSGSLMGKN